MIKKISLGVLALINLSPVSTSFCCPLTGKKEALKILRTENLQKQSWRASDGFWPAVVI